MDDAQLTEALAGLGLVVTAIQRTPHRMLVITRTALGSPVVAVVFRAINEQDVVFAKLATRALGTSPS